jgi:phosphoglycolate phosphatase-like HAD superfamily hydrolase
MEAQPDNPVYVFDQASALLWDFDGVLLDSMPIRNAAFRHVLRDYPTADVEALLEWHIRNGGLSRYVKFRHFQTEILRMVPYELLVQQWAAEFSDYCKARLADPSLLIGPSNHLLPTLAARLPMHIVSGSDGNELRGLCDALNLTHHFVSIEGSPTPKTELVSAIMRRHTYDPNRTWLIGDSINDFEAAHANGINFMGFGNPEVRICSGHFWSTESV